MQNEDEDGKTFYTASTDSWAGLLSFSDGQVGRRIGQGRAVGGKVFSTGILKISVVTGKREYRIYREFIGDTKKNSDKIYKEKHSFCSENHVHQFYIILDKKANVHIL